MIRSWCVTKLSGTNSWRNPLHSPSQLLRSSSSWVLMVPSLKPAHQPYLCSCWQMLLRSFHWQPVNKSFTWLKWKWLSGSRNSSLTNAKTVYSDSVMVGTTSICSITWLHCRYLLKFVCCSKFTIAYAYCFLYAVWLLSICSRPTQYLYIRVNIPSQIGMGHSHGSRLPQSRHPISFFLSAPFYLLF